MTKTDAAARRRRAARLSLIGAVVVLGGKAIAALATGSLGLLSDAAESLVNVVAAVGLLVAVQVARTPPDYRHPYGHQKVEDLSSAFEAALILVASIAIAITAAGRLLEPEPLDAVPLGLALAGGSALANGALAWWIGREGRRSDSAALRANGRHLLTDVWTSAGVIVGVGMSAATGWWRLDPIVAMVVAAHIARAGLSVLGSAVSQLMDERLPADEERRVIDVLESHPEVLGFHRLRSRRAGRSRFVEVDVFVPGDLTVRRAHDLVGALEDEIHGSLPNLITTVHVEPYERGRRDGSTLPEEEFPKA